MKKISHAFFYAIQFLTRLPLPAINYVEHSASRSVLFFPVVGFLIGLLFYLEASIFAVLNPLLLAALILFSWVWITGNLHLDGLADCADALVGGHGNRQKILKIMHDPVAGPAAVSAVVCSLLLKFVAIYSLLKQSDYVFYLVIIPMMARTLVLAWMNSCDYVREQGIASDFLAHYSRPLAWQLIILLAFLLLGFNFSIGLLLIVAAVILFYVYRTFWLKRIGGISGDVLGAGIEISEVVLLLVLVVFLETTY